MLNRIINLGAFSILTLLWLGFGAALLLNREMLDATWQMFAGWPLIIQIVVGLLVLPIAVGLWIWETQWPLVLRLILVAGLAGATIYTFFPGRAQTGPKGAVDNH